MTPIQLQKIYNEASGCDKHLSRSEPILDVVLEKFGGQVMLNKPENSSAFLYNNNLLKGEIAYHFTQQVAKHRRDYELTEQKLTNHDCRKATAASLRKNVSNATKTFLNWPLTSQELTTIKTKFLLRWIAFWANCYVDSKIASHQNRKFLFLQSPRTLCTLWRIANIAYQNTPYFLFAKSAVLVQKIS